MTPDYRELPSDQAAELRGAGPGVEVQILPHHTGEGECSVPCLMRLRFTSWDGYTSYTFQALTKFLKCVNWDLPQEAKQALELLGKWRPMDVEDSLELLSSQFTNPTVRRYAVARLQQADDEVSRKGG